MLNFKNISPNADFYSKLELIESRLVILNKNLLYCTHMDDKILKLIKSMTIDKNLQNTVDEYFEEDEKDTPEVEDGNRSSN